MRFSMRIQALPLVSSQRTFALTNKEREKIKRRIQYDSTAPQACANVACRWNIHMQPSPSLRRQIKSPSNPGTSNLNRCPFSSNMNTNKGRRRLDCSRRDQNNEAGNSELNFGKMRQFAGCLSAESCLRKRRRSPALAWKETGMINL